ncbi:MAG: winged helix-turn-helix domain-containing protein [Chloroflexota bacterium]|nr:winged helix-turn-helix domain-containing protein [Chloroflexota bacterium]
MEFFDIKTTLIFSSFAGLILIFLISLFVLKNNYLLLVNKNYLEKINRKNKSNNESIAEKERILDIYQQINSDNDPGMINNTLSSNLKTLINLKELKILYRKNGSENLQILSEENEGKAIIPFRKLPSNETLKNNKSISLKFHEMKEDCPWVPDNFTSCIMFPSFKNSNFLGIVCLFFENNKDEDLFSTNIKSLLNTSMKLIWYHLNYSSNNLMENMLSESGRLNKNEENFVKIGSMKIDKNKSEISIDGNYVDITNQEFNILEFLALNKGEYVTTEELLKDAWDKSNVSISAVEIALFRLRQKLSKHKNGINFIKNKTGKGYTLNAV